MRQEVDLRSHVALVTGAGRGFGWGIAVALARAGARVCVTDVNEGDITRAVSDIEAEGGTAWGCGLDAEGPSFEATADKVTTDPDAFRARPVPGRPRAAPGRLNPGYRPERE